MRSKGRGWVAWRTGRVGTHPVHPSAATEREATTFVRAVVPPQARVRWEGRAAGWSTAARGTRGARSRVAPVHLVGWLSAARAPTCGLGGRYSHSFGHSLDCRESQPCCSARDRTVARHARAITC